MADPNVTFPDQDSTETSQEEQTQEGLVTREDIKRAQVTIRQVCKQIESATYEVQDATALAACLRDMTTASSTMTDNLGSALRKRADTSFKTLSQQSAAARKIKVKGQGKQQTVDLQKRRNLKGQMWRRAECNDVASSILNLYISGKQNAVDHLWDQNISDKELLAAAESLDPTDPKDAYVCK